MGAGCFLSLFYFFGGRKTDRAGLGGGCMPRRWRPQPPAHPERLHSTGSSAGRARTRAGQVPGQTTQGTTRAQTLDTLHRADQDGGAGERALVYCVCNVLCACTFNLEYTIDLYV
nr:MAG TPA: hypothetical protein [Caudoviricetes sp.]